MTEQQIKRAKRLAEILGITVYDNCDGPTQDDCFLDFYDPRGDMGPKVFSPEQDKALLWDLFLKNKDSMPPSKLEFLLEDGTGAAAALIDCVIEINGGYDEANK